MKVAVRFFRVLGDEARLKILWLLLNHRELCVCDVMAIVGIGQSKASRHLATLRQAGLLIDRKDGLWSYYSYGPSSDELTSAHCELLRSTLARLPDAEELLERLKSWLEVSSDGASCTKDAASAFAAGKGVMTTLGKGSKR